MLGLAVNYCELHIAYDGDDNEEEKGKEEEEED